jgi:hypothetical protein
MVTPLSRIRVGLGGFCFHLTVRPFRSSPISNPLDCGRDWASLIVPQCEPAGITWKEMDDCKHQEKLIGLMAK